MKTTYGSIAFALPVAMTLAACSGSNGAATGSDGGVPGQPVGASSSLPCDVDAVLGAHCRTCHGANTQFGAPMSLVTHEDLVAPSRTNASRKVYDVAHSRIHDDSNPMPPPPNARLSADDAAVIDAWVAAGAPAGTQQSCTGPGGSGTGGGIGTGGGGADGGGTVIGSPDGGIVAPLPCTPDTAIHPGSPYAVPPGAEEYICYGFDTTSSSKRHIIALAPDIDNTAVVHHLLLYKVPNAVSPTPGPCGLGTSGELVTGWAPGVGNLILPPEAGFPEEGTTHWVMQIHYNNLKGTPNQTDKTGYKFCTTDKLRPNDAGTLAFGSINFSIPPKGSLSRTCDYTFPGSTIHAFTAQPHMHLRGRAMSTLNTTTSETIVDAPNFSFQQQDVHSIKYDIKSGDVIRNTCTWQNDTDNPITFGPTTEDEMCFDFVTYYPLITTPGWSWETPSASGSCTSK